MSSSVGHALRADLPSPRRQSGDRTKAAKTPGGAGAVDQMWPLDDVVTMTVTAGAVGAGAALLEVALLPSLALGAAVALAPRLACGTLPWLRRQVEPRRKAPIPRNAAKTSETDRRETEVPPPIARRLGVERAVAKTVTFRIIVTGLDFTWNLIILGEAVTAAGLSGISIVGGPLFYFIHEATWNYLEPPVKSDGAPRRSGDGRPSLMVLPANPNSALTEPSVYRIGPLKIGRALAKTIVYRTLATTIEFTTNYVVVGNIGEAAALSAAGVVVGPFVYLGHEILWDRLWPTTREVASAQEEADRPSPEGSPYGSEAALAGGDSRGAQAV
jgi:uncharacterized membrane protein